MAIAEIAIRSLPDRAKDVRQTSLVKVALRLVPDFDVRNVEHVDNRKFVTNDRSNLFIWPHRSLSD